MRTDPSTPFLDAAAAIGGRLCRDAIWHGARCNWVGDGLEPAGGQWLPVRRALGPALYDGAAGIGLFLAELYAATGEAPFRTAARGALALAVTRRGDLNPSTRVALHTGLAGIAWAVARASLAMDDAELREVAAGLAAELAGVEPAEGAVDVISGSAGAVPAMLGLARATGVGALADVAVRHGDFLLGLALPGPSGTAWPSPGVESAAPLTGYSHGASGVALALLELAHATGEARFGAAAREGFRYERALLDPLQGNWPDLRVIEAGAARPAPVCGVAWCHGAPGIGLARLRAMRLAPDDALAADANVALQTTSRVIRESIDAPGGGFSLCHGHAGNAETLLAAHTTTGGGEYLEFAREVGRRGVALYESRDLPWPGGVPGGATPSLMLGDAGIGHFLLRLHDPAATPSIVLVEPESLVASAPRPAIAAYN